MLHHGNFSANIRHFQEFLLQHSFRSATLLQRDSKTGVFCEICVFCEIFKNSFFYEHVCWLLLDIILVSKLVCDYFFSVIKLIFCHEAKLISRLSFFSDIGQQQRCVICTLSSSDDIRANEVYEAVCFGKK